MATTDIKQQPITAEESELAALRELEAMIARTPNGHVTLSGKDGRVMALPNSAVAVLRQALDPLANHRPVEVHALPVDITVEDAAAALERSADMLMDQLERRDTPVHYEQGVARISYRDFLVLKRRWDALNRLTRDGQALEPLLRGATVRRLSEFD